jgi:MFS transporter, Spinster family, sphingosine-1-phosphate transporter
MPQASDLSPGQTSLCHTFAVTEGQQSCTSCHMTDSQVGFLSALVSLGIAVITIPAAMFGDRWARRKITAVMAAIWSVFTLVTGLSSQLWQVFIARFMVGAGEAGYGPVGITWLSVSFRKEIRSVIISVFLTMSQIGAVAGLIIGGLLITMTKDWRMPFFVFAVPGIILAVITWSLPDYKVERKEGESALSKDYFKDCLNLFKVKSFWLMVACIAFVYFVIFPIQAWIPALLIRGYKMTAAQAGLSFGLILLSSIFAPLLGILADKWQKRSKNGRPYFVILSIAVGLPMLLLTLLNMGAPIPIFVALFAVTWIVLSSSVPILLGLYNDVLPTRLRSTGIGIGTFLSQILGSSLGIYYAGFVSDLMGGGARGLQWGIIGTIPFGVLAIVAALFMLKYYAADSAKISDELIAEK